ncbi:CCD42 protein, partial [Penelope pileata]|nr:CCD42 protein [Penelope pileata]
EEDSLSPFIRLQEKKKEAQRMQQVLEVKEEAFRLRIADITCRWKDLRAKKDELKAYMQKSRKTLKENEKMRLQALKKAGKEREMKILKHSELLRARKELGTLKSKHQKLSDRVQKYSIFRKYLDDVVTISPFEDIQTIIRRYKMLVRTHKDLLQAEWDRTEVHEQGKEFVQYTEDKDEILQHNTELDQLELLSDRAHRDVLTQEPHWAGIQKAASKKTLELAAIRMAILSLFQ